MVSFRPDPTVWSKLPRLPPAKGSSLTLRILQFRGFAGRNLGPNQWSADRLLYPVLSTCRVETFPAA
jgi:hypothetical protein